MTLEEFFKSEICSLPRAGFAESSQTFDRFLAEMFERYLAALGTLDDPKFPAICARIHAGFHKAEEFSRQIISTVEKHLSGYPHDAYNEIKVALEIAPIEKLYSSLSTYGFEGQAHSELEQLLNCIAHPPLYRVRANREASATSGLSRTDIFHIPFEKRNLVANYRYSISGLPCLYLGSSIWMCWEELGRPELDTVLVSRFTFAKSALVLDFQFPPVIFWGIFSFLNRTLEKHDASDGISDAVFDQFKLRFNDESVAAYLLCWPLIAACSIKVDSRKGSFFPHYIVPQLLLQWVTSMKNIDGIRYFSTRVPPNEANPYSNSNCVFPARNISQKGLCSHLNGLFNLTSPITWDLLQAVDLAKRFQFGPSNVRGAMKLSDDVFVGYNVTAFFTAEAKLEMLEEEGKFSKPAMISPGLP